MNLRSALVLRMHLKPPPASSGMFLRRKAGSRLSFRFWLLVSSLLTSFVLSLSFESVAAQASSFPKAPVLISSVELAKAGYFQLRWESAKGALYELQESRDPEFADAATLYRGRDLATFVSGRPDGLYHYRLRGGSGEDGFSPWSRTVSVRVRHYDSEDSLFVLFLGFLVFLSTFLLIGLGHLRANRRSDPRF